MNRQSTDAIQPVRLGALERQVMDALWDHGQRTVRELIADLSDRHAYTTIATVLGNLERKELVTSHRLGRSVHYRAHHSREEHAAHAMGSALAGSGDRAMSIMHFVESMPPEDVELLRTYLSSRGELR